MKTCFFIGHRDAPSSIEDKLEKTIHYLRSVCGVSQFVAGHHGNFDRMALSAIENEKHLDPGIYAYVLLEYYCEKPSAFLPACFNGYYLPYGVEGAPKRFAIEKANKIMASECHYLVAYANRDGGNAAKLLRYAIRHGQQDLQIINLATDVFPPE